MSSSGLLGSKKVEKTRNELVISEALLSFRKKQFQNTTPVVCNSLRPCKFSDWSTVTYPSRSPDTDMHVSVISCDGWTFSKIQSLKACEK